MDADRSYIEAWQKRLRQEQEALDQAAQQARKLLHERTEIPAAAGEY